MKPTKQELLERIEEIIDETVAFYSEDTSRRSMEFDGGTCLYNGPKGEHCAVARCAINPSDLKEEETANEVLSEDLKELKPEYRVGGLDFWLELQNLHDTDSNWGEYGITSDGTNAVVTLKEKCRQ